MSTSIYTSATIESIAKATFVVYDYFVYATFIFKPFVIAFFIYHFINKTLNICNVFFYLLFIGFVVDTFAWILVIVDGFCWDYSKNASTECWYIDAVFVPYSHYNNTFSSFWILLLSINRLTSVILYSKYEKIWSKLFKPSIILLFILPFTIIGNSFANYKCAINLGCKVPNYWVTFGTISAIGNGTLSLVSFIIALYTALIYRKRKNLKINIQNSDVKLIFQAGVTSLVCIIHYVFYTVAEGYRAYKVVHPEYKYEIGYVFISTIQFMAYPGYHFTSYFYLFIFSSRLKRQFLELYHLTWLYKLTQCCQSNTTTVQRINNGHACTTTTSRTITKSAAPSSIT